MKCAFHRPEEINVEEFNNIVNGLKKDLAAMESGSVTKEETIQYLRELLPQARFLDHTPDMCFFGLDEPQHMPSDARVEYFYKPTYLAAAMLMHACVTYPGILEELLTDAMPPEELQKVVCGIFLGCTDRNLEGHGFDGLKGKLEALELFLEAGFNQYNMSYCHICPRFHKLMESSLMGLSYEYESGPVLGDWGEDCTGEVHDILVKAGIILPEENEKGRL